MLVLTCIVRLYTQYILINICINIVYLKCKYSVTTRNGLRVMSYGNNNFKANLCLTHHTMHSTGGWFVLTSAILPYPGKVLVSFTESIFLFLVGQRTYNVPFLCKHSLRNNNIQNKFKYTSVHKSFVLTCTHRTFM